MNINHHLVTRLKIYKKGKYKVLSGKQAGKTLDVTIIAESKRYYWIKIFNTVQRKKKHKVEVF